MNVNHHEPNPHLRRLDEIREARDKYRLSEWLLNHLRTLSSTPTKQLTDEELLTWNKQH